MNSALRIPRPFLARIWLLWSEMHEMEIVERMELGLYNAQLIAQQHGSRIGEGLDSLSTLFRHPPANPCQNAYFIRLR